MLRWQGALAAALGWKGRMLCPTDLAGGNLGGDGGMQLQQIQAPFSVNGGEKNTRHFSGTVPALASEAGQSSHSTGDPCTTGCSRQGPAWVAGPKPCRGVR